MNTINTINQSPHTSYPNPSFISGSPETVLQSDMHTLACKRNQGLSVLDCLNSGAQLTSCLRSNCTRDMRNCIVLLKEGNYGQQYAKGVLVASAWRAP
ncbi:uncharacterized protein BDR25DRAFT_363695 [Lindgomyces ingoldianus]|uniref:Uncharacterized protein n=1 Tax=Lindgomyces ingoldianus TaxID=673940 RepID=A0ACB6Q7B1_9PLEO|nr:uncharacterized protein BDR25DRAFT_363695 [Lindgomyces ingoldianus]KAF2462692.1 hypothetical protein BDR25DRAFT_363695 [Lindgomyces ingoldianus]